MSKIIILIIILTVCYLYNNSYEHMTNDEAISNVASLYNTSMATVSNFKVTNDANIDGKLGVTGKLTSNGGIAINKGLVVDTITSGNATFTDIAKFKGAGGSDTWFPYTDGNNYIRGPTIIDGPVTLNGTLKLGNYTLSAVDNADQLRIKHNNPAAGYVGVSYIAPGTMKIFGATIPINAALQINNMGNQQTIGKWP
jgi:hypothetical protein